MLTVLVTGGRDYQDWETVFRVLDEIHKTNGICKIVHGDAHGADSIASDWAVSRHVESAMYYANWKEFGKAAGQRRNQYMLDDAKPSLVVAFPGGKGTRNMVSLAISRGIPVHRVYWTDVSGV